MQYKIDFKKLNWEVPFEGIKHKYSDQENIRIRLVEYDRSMPPHWCEKSHYGYILEGIFEIEFDSQKVTYEKGDGLFLPAGVKHCHKGRAITERVLIFFIEMLSKY